MIKTEIIIIRETAAQSLVKDAGTFVLFASLIGVGVLLDSGAMQWVGAVMGFVTIFTWAIRSTSKNRMTIEQARAKLDEIEAR